MENLKIRVNGEAESKEIQINLEQLGFKKSVWGIFVHNSYFIFANCNYYSKDGIENFSECDYKEITLPELRDLVVLKRNDVEDASHINCNGQYMYEASSGDWYLYHNNAWKSDGVDIDDMPKPIEKPMKEYLRKNSNGTHSYIGTVRPEHVSDFMIEIPKWANFAAFNQALNKYYFNKEDIYIPNYVIWSHHTHPEELPFIDDEPLQSLNDQYAEIEKVRQPAWQKQEGGSHYKNLKIQPMQYALENKLDYAQANVVKYVTRHKEKNGKEDLLKAIHNIELMIEFYYGDEK